MIRYTTVLLAMAVLFAFAGGVAKRDGANVPAVVPAGHMVLRFESYPDPEVRAELARRRVRVLAFVPPCGLLVASRGPWSARGLGLVKAGAIEASTKMSRELNHNATGSYLAIFHSDIDAGMARRLAEDVGLEVLQNPGLLPGHLLLAGGWDRVRTLAGRDEIAHILPPSSDLLARRPVHGCPGPISEAGIVADYSLEGGGWPADSSGGVSLRFLFGNITAKLDESVVRDQVNKAFQEWARYTKISIAAGQQAGAARAIEIRFVTGSHGDPYPFTSASTLAHAFYPPPANPEPVAGDIHFNDAESWNAANGIDLFSVALHEAGHSLGLAHSGSPNSVMYPYYRQAAGLTDDDIAAIQALYGKPAPAQPPVTPPPTPPVQPPPTPPQPPAPSPPTGSTDTIAPSLGFTSPGSTIVSVYTSSIAISGTASDNIGVVSVVWTTSTGGSGVAAGTTRWAATIPLLIGNTAVTVRAFDAAGNSAWRSITVVRVN